MYNINIFEHIQDMCLLHNNIIQWDSEESQFTYEVRLPCFVEKSGIKVSVFLGNNGLFKAVTE